MPRTFSEVNISQCTYPFLYLKYFVEATPNVNYPHKASIRRHKNTVRVNVAILMGTNIYKRPSAYFT